MNIQKFLLSINGSAALVANDGTFLGVVSSNQHDLNSICNLQGQYGSRHGLYSVRNPHSLYGGSHALDSPYNPNCSNPPVIVYQGRVVLRVTKNTYYISSDMVPLIDPDVLFDVLISVGSYALPASNTTQFQHMVSPATAQRGFTAKDYVEQGDLLFSVGHYEDAIAAYNQAVQLKPDFAEAWYNRGNVLLKLQQYEEAIASFDRMIQLKPQLPEGWIMRGLALINWQRYAEAIAAYEQAIQLQPDNLAGWHGKACCYALQGNIELAIKNLKGAIEFDPTFREKVKNASEFDLIQSDERYQ